MTLSRATIATLALAITAASHVTARRVRQPKPVWVVLVDDFHLQFTSTGYLRELLRALVTDVIQEGEDFTIGLSSRRTEDLRRTTDRIRLDSFLRDVAGMGVRPTDAVISAEVELRERLMRQSAARLLDTVAEERNRRLRLIVISNGWPSGPDGQSVHTLVSRGKTLGIPIVTIHPQQFVRRQSPNSPVDPKVTALLATAAASLRAVADRTGGLAILESRELTEVVGLVRKAIKPV